MGLDLPGLAHRGIAVVALRGVLGEASAAELTARLCRVLAADPHLLIIDLAGLRGWDETGQRQLAGVAAYLAARGGRMVLSTGGAHLRRTDPGLAALEVFADVPAAVAADRATSRLPRMRPRRVSLPSGSELLRHAYFPAPSQAGEVAAAGAWAGIVLGSWGVTVRAGPVVAALSELVANAVAYGFSGAVGITLRLWRGPGGSRWLTVAVHDGNPAPPVLRAPKAQAPVQRGWGLLIVVVQADAHGWYPDADAGVPGKTVWFACCIHPWRPGHQHPVSPGCS